MAVFSICLPESVRAEDTVGQNRTFLVDKNYDSQKRSSLTASLRLIGRHAYYYVDDSFWSARSSDQHDALLRQITTLADTFDTVIYPTETTTWGSEPNPGVDGDPRVYILLDSLTTGSGGYFETIHGYRKDQAPQSNEHEMMVISTVALDTSLTKTFLAHEFQHLISFQQKELAHSISEETWLNELRSQYAPTLVGFNAPYTGSDLERRVNTFLQNPLDSLTEWPNTVQDYAPVTLFGHYATGRFGVGILSDSLKSALTGITSLNQWLTDKKLPQRFSQVFIDWVIASYINDHGGDGRYGYAQPALQNIHVSPTYRSMLSNTAQYALTYSLKGWEPLWHEMPLDQPLDNDHGLKISFAGTTGDLFPFGLVVFYSDGTFQVRNDKPLNGPFTMYVLNPEPQVGQPVKRVTKVLLALTYAPSYLGGTYEEKNLNGQIQTLTAEEILQEVKAAPPDTVIVSTESVQDGALIKRNNNETEMYVVTGRYKRYLRPEIIRLYGQLDPAQVIPVVPSIFDSYSTANYVRAAGDKKVWVVWPDGTKHWLNITGEQFTSSGRDWNAIFTINDAELAAYKVGVDITR